jgi:hypothetical protein
MSATIGPPLTSTVTFAPPVMSVTITWILDTSSLPKLIIEKEIPKADPLQVSTMHIKSKKIVFFIVKNHLLNNRIDLLNCQTIKPRKEYFTNMHIYILLSIKIF